MRVIVNLSGRDPATQAWLRQLAAQASAPSTSRPLSPFPLSLLEQMLRAGLDGLEAVLRRGVRAIGRRRAP